MKHIRGLQIDRENGAGGLELPLTFQREFPAFKVDVLADWLRLVRATYDEAVIELQADLLGCTEADYCKMADEAAEAALSGHGQAIAGLAGKTISEIVQLEDGAVKFRFTDGSEHAVYHREMCPEAPVLVSMDLALPRA
jgi:hypothetical protein